MRTRLSLLFCLVAFIIVTIIISQFPHVGDARSAAREAACVQNLRTVRDRMIRYRESAYRPEDQASAVVDLRSIIEALELDATNVGDSKLRCALTSNETGRDGLVWPPETTKINLRRLQGESIAPTDVIVCHDSEHLHRVNTMVHTIVLLSNGDVRRVSITDEKKYREWVEGKFRMGRTSYTEFLSDAGVQRMK